MKRFDLVEHSYGDGCSTVDVKESVKGQFIEYTDYEKENNIKQSLTGIRVMIEEMRLISDSALDLTEERRICRATIMGYNKAILDVCNRLKDYNS